MNSPLVAPFSGLPKADPIRSTASGRGMLPRVDYSASDHAGGGGGKTREDENVPVSSLQNFSPRPFHSSGSQ